MGDSARAHRVVADAIAAFGGLDVLVNNAGIDADAPSADLSLDDWDRVLAVNLTGAFACAQAAGRHMLGRGSGVIVSLGSLWGNLGMPERAAYAASKHGLAGLTRALAAEWGPHGVRLVTVDPGYISTAMIESVRGGTGADLLRRTPAGRLGTPEEVAHAVVFLASERGRAVTGAGLRVDGGWMAYGGW